MSHVHALSCVRDYFGLRHGHLRESLVWRGFSCGGGADFGHRNNAPAGGWIFHCDR